MADRSQSRDLAPVVLFVYARPAHTEQTVTALRDSAGARDCDVVVFCDGPKQSNVEDAVRDVKRYINSLPGRGWFRSVDIRESPRNLGLAKSVIAGVSEIFSKHDKAVVLEDDLIVAPDFLAYMNEALSHFSSDPRIWSISGYSPPLSDRLLRSYRYDLYLSGRGGSWGWGTWRRNWSGVDWGVRSYPSFEFNYLRRRRFNRTGRDLSAMLDAQMDGRVDSWAVRWCYAQFEAQMLTVYPVRSKVRNIGLDGSGTHGVVENPVVSELPLVDVSFEPLELDDDVAREFARSYARYNTVPAYSFLRHLAAKRPSRTKPRG